MGDKNSGINIGNVGGGVNINAGGDIVGGDKNTGDTNITIGLKSSEEKNEFLGMMDELKSCMREIKAETENSGSIDEDRKDELILALMQQIKNVKEVEDTVESSSVESAPPKDMIDLVKNNLGSIEEILNEVKKESGEGGFMEKIIPVATKALPILLSARHLFGLP